MSEDIVVLDTTDQDDMEEGELSDDGLPLPPPPSAKPTRTPIKMDLPDLLKELKGAEEFKVNPETISKMSARAERFQTGNSVSFEEISALYNFMKVVVKSLDTNDDCPSLGEPNRSGECAQTGDDLRLVA